MAIYTVKAEGIDCPIECDLIEVMGEFLVFKKCVDNTFSIYNTVAILSSRSKPIVKLHAVK